MHYGFLTHGHIPTHIYTYMHVDTLSFFDFIDFDS